MDLSDLHTQYAGVEYPPTEYADDQAKADQIYNQQPTASKNPVGCKIQNSDKSTIINLDYGGRKAKYSIAKWAAQYPAFIKWVQQRQKEGQFKSIETWLQKLAGTTTIVRRIS